ncbi:hypothetical protein [Bosea sp. (in: a-proteobacteria)]|uniref:hypothetical protein n=1 Tax=Bosea sp. (in: a-proteobacteria) TaxID=1871050 RepID=UPI003B3BC8F5
MSGSYPGGAVASFGFERSGLPVVEAVSAVARRLWPNKTARHLAARAGTTHRAAEYWLGQQTGMSADALAELLRSDAGLAMLEAIMGSARPNWWPTFRQEAKASAIADRLESIRAEIDEARRGLG